MTCLIITIIPNRRFFRLSGPRCPKCEGHDAGEHRNLVPAVVICGYSNVLSAVWSKIAVWGSAKVTSRGLDGRRAWAAEARWRAS
jgi:hypothetical protein